MSSPNPESQNNLDISTSSERQFIQKSLQSLIRWMPLGGSIGIFISALLQDTSEQKWVLIVFTFPVTVVSAFWAAYVKSFLERLEEVASEKGRRDVDWLGKQLSYFQEALRWQLSNFEGKYREAQADACVYDEVQGFRRLESSIKTATLEEVFVPPEFSHGAPTATQLGGGVHLENSIKKRNQQNSLSIWDILATVERDPRSRSLIIQAWGGYGKTTLLKYLAYTYAHTPGEPRKHKSPALIPVLLHLRKWRDLIAQSNAPSLPALITKHHIPDLFPGHFPEGSNRKSLLTKLVPPNWAEFQLLRGRMLVLLDGLDEVDISQFRLVSQWISRQLKTYNKSVFIITSRPSGYAEYERYASELPKTYLFVKPFNKRQWTTFMQRWYLCQEQRSRSQSERHHRSVKSSATRSANDLIHQITQRREQGYSELEEMAGNPLLLNMLATFHYFYEGSPLPQHRIELYRDICKLQLEDRPRAKGIMMPLGSLEQRQSILQKLALDMVKMNTTRLDRTHLEQQLKDSLATVNEKMEATDFLKQIIDVSELLVERDIGQFEFAHLSFQSYLAAVELKQTQQESLILDYLNECGWDVKVTLWQETVRLYVAQNPTNLLQNADSNLKCIGV